MSALRRLALLTDSHFHSSQLSFHAAKSRRIVNQPGVAPDDVSAMSLSRVKCQVEAGKCTWQTVKYLGLVLGVLGVLGGEVYPSPDHRIGPNIDV